MRKKQEIEIPSSCFNRAADDELIFVLRGRDTAAPSTIRFWAAERLRLGKNETGDDQISEAHQCAEIMEAEQKQPPSPPANNSSRFPVKTSNLFLVLTVLVGLVACFVSWTFGYSDGKMEEAKVWLKYQTDWQRAEDLSKPQPHALNPIAVHWIECPDLFTKKVTCLIKNDDGAELGIVLKQQTLWSASDLTARYSTGEVVWTEEYETEAQAQAALIKHLNAKVQPVGQQPDYFQNPYGQRDDGELKMAELEADEIEREEQIQLSADEEDDSRPQSNVVIDIPEKLDCKWADQNGPSIDLRDMTAGCECPHDYEPRAIWTSASGSDILSFDVSCHLKKSAKYIVRKNAPLCVDVFNDRETSAPYPCAQ